MFDEENESSIEQMQGASIVPFLLGMSAAIIVLLVVHYLMGGK